MFPGRLREPREVQPDFPFRRRALSLRLPTTTASRSGAPVASRCRGRDRAVSGKPGTAPCDRFTGMFRRITHRPCAYSIKMRLWISTSASSAWKFGPMSRTQGSLHRVPNPGVTYGSVRGPSVHGDSSCRYSSATGRSVRAPFGNGTSVGTPSSSKRTESTSSSSVTVRTI